MAILLGDEGVEDAGFEAGGGEGALDDAVVASGAFDGDQAVVELVLSEGVANLADGRAQFGAVVGDGGRRDEDPAVEVGEEELGAGLGTVKADDAKVFRSDLLDAGVQDSAGLTDRGCRPPLGGPFAGAKCSHDTSLRKKGWGSSHSRRRRSGKRFCR